MKLNLEVQEEIAKLSLTEFWDAYEDVAASEGEDAATAMLIERCRTDVECFAMAFFPHYCPCDFNKFHRALFKRWKNNKKKVRTADAAPRGAAKSTILALIKPIHDLCYGLENFIVIISNTLGQASGRLKDIRTELIDNTELIDCFGPFFKAKKVSETQYIAHSGDHSCMFAGFGSGTEIRGVRFGPHRPSKIILDDAEHSEEVENEDSRSKVEAWHRQVISKLGDENTKIEIIGTILHRDSLLANLLKNPAYEGTKYQAIESWADREDLWEQWRDIYINVDNDNRKIDALDFYEEHKAQMLLGTKILWPERESYYDLQEEIVEIGRRSFMKERQNEPMSAEESLFDDIGWYRETEQGFIIEESGILIPRKDIRPEVYATLDPATGQTKAKRGKKGDFACLLTGLVDGKGRLLVHSDWTKRAKPTEQINRVFDENEIWNYHTIGVETNLFRELLLPNLERERKEREAKRRAEYEDKQARLKKEGRRVSKSRKSTPWGIQVAFKDIEQTENKQKRIYTLEPKVKNRYILFNRNLSSEFKGQLEAFPNPTSHDDGPDALEMLWAIVYSRYQMGGINLNTQRGR